MANGSSSSVLYKSVPPPTVLELFFSSRNLHLPTLCTTCIILLHQGFAVSSPLLRYSCLSKPLSFSCALQAWFEGLFILLSYIAWYIFLFCFISFCLFLPCFSLLLCYGSDSGSAVGRMMRDRIWVNDLAPYQQISRGGNPQAVRGRQESRQICP